MLRIGLTGGIGAGKSTVSRILGDLGAVVVDADLIAREVVEPGTAGLDALVREFGPEILLPDGRLDRPALAAKAFGDETARGRLNGILHPLIGARTAELVDAASDSVVLQDIPLLVEGGMGAMFHLVVVVHVDAEERVRRLVDLRGMSEGDARARISSQATDEQRRAVADVWLDNSGPAGALDPAVKVLWERLQRYAENIANSVVVRVPPVLTPANPDWAEQGRRLAGRLRFVCGADAMRVDHVGSTAVPGLAAKDVIDLQVTVRSLADADALADRLTQAGFPRVDAVTADDPKPAYGIGGEVDPSLWDKRFHASADPGRPANVHVRVDGWPGQRFALVFRDWLCADGDVRAEYLEVKRRAAEVAAGESDVTQATDRYVEAKTPWFDAAHRRALEWADRTEWTPGQG
ncbi:dephospho-CoA kinase [Rhodococcus sp. NPDC058505]|uniref:dephospho-CoA kinase n=1 Tax=unclassified Rhodococcus (in: high G+C Gram-positive bacteria) TaxID=192944 RepID=UPI003658C09D